MKLNFNANLAVVGKEQGEYEGKPTYKISVSQGAQAGTIKATADVFNAVSRFKFYDLGIMINTEYNTITANKVVGETDESGSPLPSPTSVPRK